MFRWGFVPHWAANAKGPRPVNAKVETLAEKPAFRDSFRERRCLIPADGFYEWRTTPDGKKPLFYRLKSGELMALAGVWDVWRGPTEKLFTCAIITTSCNSLIEPVHDRMPAILDPSRYAQWLDPKNADAGPLLSLLSPWPADDMAAVAANPWVNNARNEGPASLSA